MNEDSSDDETAGPSTQSGPSGVARYDISKYYLLQAYPLGLLHQSKSPSLRLLILTEMLRIKFLLFGFSNVFTISNVISQ